ncbi:MAG: hypothetical protein JO083_03260 [Candidatus Eremiobacteraeota bacterium]|nr:hypothetical protein [Candidatus Eremiobacteraeota bacterium]
MLARRTFVAASAALLAAGAPSRALAFVGTETSGVPRTPQGQARTTLDAVAVIAATHLEVRTAWRPPSVFPEIAPVAYYPGRGADPRYPGEVVVWLNPDHPELISPRVSRLTDEIPLFTELLLASVDVRASGLPSLGLESLDPVKRRILATTLASDAAVIAKYSPYPPVDDAEFARRAFAFAVLRQMTPGIGGIAPIEVPASAMPREEPLAAYVGRYADARAPRGWGVIHIVGTSVPESPGGSEAWVRAFVLATADRQPADSAVKRAYEAARAQDEASSGDHYAARRAFAAPYVTQVAALFGR